jgi:hypothetical protein
MLGLTTAFAVKLVIFDFYLLAWFDDLALRAGNLDAEDAKVTQRTQKKTGKRKEKTKNYCSTCLKRMIYWY